MRASVCVLIVLVGCGDNGDPPIRGEHHSYVMSRQDVPGSNTEARELGLDVNSDGTPDNQAGMVLGRLATDNFVQSQVRTDRAIDRGALIQLIDLQLPGPRDLGAAAGFVLHGGSTPTPAPCASDADTVCRRHLDGNGVFALDSASEFPPVASFADENDRYFGGPGRLSLQLAVFSKPIRLDLVAAQVVFDVLADGTLRGRIGGAITEDDLYGKLMPDFLTLVLADVELDCTLRDAPIDCGCRPDSAGKIYLGLFDVSPTDCIVSFEEVIHNSLVVSMLSRDVVIDGAPALSIGIGFEAVPAVIE